MTDLPHTKPPRFAEALLRRLLPASQTEALVGDLAEEFASKQLTQKGRQAATWWYRREALIALLHALSSAGARLISFEWLRTSLHREESMTEIATRRLLAFMLALGLLGGGALITTVATTRRGPMIFLPYAAIVVVTAVYLRLEHVQHFTRRFTLALGAFMFASVLLYLFIGLFAAKTLFAISLWGHAWRLGIMLAIGSALSAAVAQLTATRESMKSARQPDHTG